MEEAARQPPGLLKTRQIGPCYTCSQWSHLARTCPKDFQKPYPFGQSAVSVSDIVSVDDSEPGKGG